MSDSEGPMRVTKTVYTVGDFVEWQRDGALDLNPYYQRGSVWTDKSKSYLIDTVLRGYPVPIIYLQNVRNSKNRVIRQVVDGQQRLRTLISFVDKSALDNATPDDTFTILKTHNSRYAGTPFIELPETVKQDFLDTELSVHVLPPTIGDRHLLQLFARLNSTGDRLNDQELRNAAYHGEFKTVAYALSYEQLQRWRDWGIFTSRAIAQMRNAELTSEFMLFLLVGLQGKTKASIDNAYKKYEDTFSYADEVANRYRRVFDVLDQLFETGNAQDLQVFKTQSWLYAAFAVIATAEFGSPITTGANWYPPLGSSQMKMTELRRGMNAAARHLDAASESGGLPEDLVKSLRGASSDAGSRKARCEFLTSYLQLSKA